MRAAEFIVPAMEIIDYRTETPRAITDTIADNAAAAAMVVGGRTIRPMDVDIRWVGATLSKNGVIEESGVSAAIMGHPAAGVAWLVNKLAPLDRKSTPLNSSHANISYVAFCLKKKHIVYFLPLSTPRNLCNPLSPRLVSVPKPTKTSPTSPTPVQPHHGYSRVIRLFLDRKVTL